MDLYTFSVKLANALAWPLCLFMIFIILKHPIIALLERLKHLNFKGLNADFINEANSFIEDVPKKLPKPTKPTAEQLWKIKELSKLSPRSAIFSAWIDVKSIVKIAAHKHNLIDAKTNQFNIIHVVSQLEADNRIQKGVVEMFLKLRHLKNDAVHLKEDSINATTAEEVAYIANKLVKSFEEV